MGESESKSPSAPTTTPLEQMESRLAELELKLGGASLTPSSGKLSTDADVTSRLDRLIRLAASSSAPSSTNNNKPSANAKSEADSKRSALHEEYRTIDRLLSELAISPMAGPTATSSLGGNTANNAPMIFRRMEILASSDTMKRDMDLLARIRDLTRIGAKGGALSDGSSWDDGSLSSSKEVVNCPIVSSEKYNLPSDPEAAERLERLCFRAAKLNQRTAVASQRADGMLNSYGTIMMALSEKMVLAEEQIMAS